MVYLEYYFLIRFIEVGGNEVAGLYAVVKYLFGQRVFKVLLDSAVQRAGAELRWRGCCINPR